MTHPFISKVTEIATPIANNLGLEVVEIAFLTNESPPILRVEVRNPEDDTSLNDCEQMSRTLEAELDITEIIPNTYVLEVSSPGISEHLTRDREYVSFKGFPVLVITDPPYKGKEQWQGTLNRRDETTVYINQKGKIVKIPRDVIQSVKLDTP
ncbi:ribosome maturation factor RimP [Euhalothece natronophila Z-M001]|uniref:Ribosome maturation factor RimP n=1 Tax=Euhalothece natronophila Z-M001 TaxID=522448 RepID=A0A5B8NNC8_9CHRO|nr:ribosome maturation factor RimP [Euhalothece natronophila]QDZ39755.1 ribosome maturation factor RimP [Euhalothece natronophila Z-M001]